MQTEWFGLSQSQDWIYFVRANDGLNALFEVDFKSDDYTTAIGNANGQYVNILGQVLFLAIDFDQRTNLVSYIDTQNNFVQQRIVQVSSDPLELEAQDVTIPEKLANAMRLDESQ